jgi:type III restriction enzyme
MPATFDFFEQPILNSPYEYPSSHWGLDEAGQPTMEIIEHRRGADFFTPIPKAKKVRVGDIEQKDLAFSDSKGLSTEDQQYDQTALINELRVQVERWRDIEDPNAWKVTPETARLMQHWRKYQFTNLRPFFCQIEAIETIIWLTEVAPKSGNLGKRFLTHLEGANDAANPGLNRLALKLATGAGKTTVMAMIIAWQTINAVRRPTSKNFTRGFLVVAPGITIKDRLRVLQPNDPGSYYQSRELVPSDLLPDIERAKIVITNYHAFKLREKMSLSKGGRSLLTGRGEDIQTQESEGQMLQRVVPGLLGVKNVMILNDEAHHCYREKPGDSDEETLKGDEKKDAQKNAEAARLWITGLEILNRKVGVRRVVDLSATPFFLSGSGYVEGTLFPWTMSDFSLMDAIECGIVKLPRVPIADNIPSDEMPKYRELWKHIRADMPKKRKGEKELDPLSIPTTLQTALVSLYGHYEETFHSWVKEGVESPPCFIIVCQNTSISKLVYDYISGFNRTNDDESTTFNNGRLQLFRNFDEHGTPFPRPRTLLIDSVQLESGEALDNTFRKAAAEEIERFRREKVERTGNAIEAQKIPDQELLREVMNTVGKKGTLGADIRCVVSVSMLTEGWDANNVTHILGVRAFGTQLLCEQVIGRALRRQSYVLNENGLFDVEYADVFGIPFDFTAKPVISKIQKPRETVHVHAVSPDRDHLEIEFPRVMGYRVELPNERLVAEFNEDSTLELTPDLVGPSITHGAGIVGEGVDFNLKYTEETRRSEILFQLTKRLVETKYRDAGEDPKYTLFGQLKSIARQWMDSHLVCKGGTYPAQLIYQDLSDMACERIAAGITRKFEGTRPIKAVLDPYNSSQTTRHVNFTTSVPLRWKTHPEKSHVNWAICDSNWELEFCRVAESHPKVKAYVKNHSLGFEVPYQYGSTPRKYRPDYIVLVDDGHGDDDLLHLVVEIKGYRGEDAKDKKSTMETYWVPGVNNLGEFGRWGFGEFTDVYTMEEDFEAKIAGSFDEMIDETLLGEEAEAS